MKYCYSLLLLGLSFSVFGAKKDIPTTRNREGILFQHLSPEGPKEIKQAAEQLPMHLQTYLSLAQKPKVIPPTTPPPPGSMTQTQAYLSFPTLKQQVDNKFGNWGQGNVLKKFEKIINETQDKEKELLYTHFVFYHAQPSSFMILYDFMKEMAKWLQVPKTENFVGLRVPAAAFNFQDIYAFIDQKMQQASAMQALGGFDTNYGMGAHLVSVNFSLFGNSNDVSIGSMECTFDFFVRNTSAMSVDPVSFLMPLMHQLNLPYSSIGKYVTQLTKLKSNYFEGYIKCKPEAGMLHQICIPRSIVDDYGYLSAAYGVYGDPNNPSGEVPGRMYSSKTKKITLFNFLSTLQSNPTAFTTGAIDNLQARLVITTDGMLNPAGGVKIFTHTTLTEECEKKYKAELAEIVKNVMYEWYKQAGVTEETLKAFVKIKGFKEQIPADFKPAPKPPIATGKMPVKKTTSVAKPWEVKKTMRSLNMLAEALSELSKKTK